MGNGGIVEPMLPRRKARRRGSLGISHERQDQVPRRGPIPVFAQVDSLPSPQAQGPILDRDRQPGPHQRCLDMGRHIIRTLDRVNIREVFRDDVVQRGFEIDTYVGISVLIDCQAGRCVLNKDVQQPDPDRGQLGNRLQHGPSDQMTSPGVGAER